MSEENSNPGNSLSEEEVKNLEKSGFIAFPRVYDRCPNEKCHHSDKKLSDVVKAQEVKKGKFREETVTGVASTIFPVSDPVMLSKTIQVPAFSILYEICLECGTIYPKYVDIINIDSAQLAKGLQSVSKDLFKKNKGAQ
jgi:hypothetical protein